ncbi:MAG: sugar-transfer associated ATP-grasp domain-containing protein [Pseudomonadota bacterium]
MSSFVWYRLKKAYALSPALGADAVPPVMEAYHRRTRESRGLMKRASDKAVDAAFHIWAPIRAKQVAQQVELDARWIANATAIARSAYMDPLDIALYDIGTASECAPFLRRFEWTAISKRINRRTWRPHCALVDKVLFAERCAHADLPHPEVMAYKRGRSTTNLSAATGDAFCKPVGGYGGKRAFVLQAGDGEMIGAHLPRDTIAQERLRPHPGMAALTGEALITARIITIFNEADEPEIVSTALRLPNDPDAIVDNGALIAPIDAETGTIGAARLLWAGGDISRRWSHHPMTGAAVRGAKLPDWEAAKSLAVHAHASAFGDYTVIGWDIGLTDQGPLLIEGNGKPSVTITQRATGRGVWDTRMGELLLHHLGSEV